MVISNYHGPRSNIIKCCWPEMTGKYIGVTKIQCHQFHIFYNSAIDLCLEWRQTWRWVKHSNLIGYSPPPKKKCSLHLKTKPVNDLKVSAFALRSSQFSASLKKSTHIWNGTQLRTRLNQMHHTNFQSSTFQRSTCTWNDTKFGTHLNQILEAGLWFFQKKKNFHFLKLHFSHIFKSVYTLNRIWFGK